MGMKEAIGANTEVNGYTEMHKYIACFAAVLWSGVASVHNLAVWFSKAFYEYCTVRSGYL
jgi:hypothetical protein